MKRSDYLYLFSVVIPVFNREKYLKRALESLSSQTFQDFEVIIVDDASNDSSLDIAKKWDFPNKIIIENNTNLERCISRNKGIAKAKGEYICFLDSDDYHLPNHLETLYNEIKRWRFPKAFFFTNAWDESDNGIRTERTCPDYKNYNPYHYFLTYTVNPQRWAVHREVVLHHLFDPEVIICEDMDVSLRMVATNVDVYQIKERTSVYVAAPDSFTHGDPEKAAKELHYLKKIFRKKELKGNLPLKAKKRLLSMCHFHLACKLNERKAFKAILYHVLKSFLLCPKGYNGKTNKTLFVTLLHNIPLFGIIFKSITKKVNFLRTNSSSIDISV